MRGWREHSIRVISIVIDKMVVRLRLQRFGRKHSPFYRMVAADARAPRDGKFLEIVSWSNPLSLFFHFILRHNKINH